MTMQIHTVIALPFLLLIMISPVGANDLTVLIGNVYGGTGSTVSVPIMVKEAQGLGSMDLIVSYEPAMLTVVSVEKGSLNQGLISSAVDTPGVISLGVVDAKGIDGNGPVAVITMKVKGAEGTSCPLRIDSVLAYNAKTHVDIRAVAESGTFTVKKGGRGIPLPPVIALVAAVGAGMFFARRKST